ncbi:MAG: (2Fe-2S)-binding protein, partial [Thermoleophilia bacterium]|nr:(2Fe-2S)-binding protein [Thermoleophilia bacterium]
MPSESDNKKTSKYTADRGWPGAFEGETVTRRGFMTGVAMTAGGVASAMFGLPALGFALGPIFEKTDHRALLDIGSTADFSGDTYVPVVITTTAGIGQAGKTLIYVREHTKPT